MLFSYAIAPVGIYRVDIPSGRVEPLPGADRFWQVKCSPKGDILAHLTSEAPAFWLLRAGRAEWEKLGPWRAGYQSWSRDGLSIVALNGERNRVERLTLATRRIEVLGELGETPLFNVGSPPWLGIAHDGSPVVTQDRSTRDLYAFDWEAP